jgi:hypothetical protein
MVGATTVSIHVVVIFTSSDWVTTTLISCFQASTTTTSNMIGEAMLTQGQ